MREPVTKLYIRCCRRCSKFFKGTRCTKYCDDCNLSNKWREIKKKLSKRNKIESKPLLIKK